MAYEKQTWINNDTPLDSEHMTHIEDGIYNLELYVNQQIGNINSALDAINGTVI